MKKRVFFAETQAGRHAAGHPQPTASALWPSLPQAATALLLMLATLPDNKARAQYVNPTMFPITAATWPAITIEDAVVNCDMLQATTNGGTIKTIAYGRRLSTTQPNSNFQAEAHVYCEDWAGNSLSFQLPTDASNPDVALANYYAREVDQTTGVVTLVPYFKVAIVYRKKCDVYLDVWQLSSAGTGSFAATNVVSAFQVNNSGHYVDTFRSARI